MVLSRQMKTCLHLLILLTGSERLSYFIRCKQSNIVIVMISYRFSCTKVRSFYLYGGGTLSCRPSTFDIGRETSDTCDIARLNRI